MGNDVVKKYRLGDNYSIDMKPALLLIGFLTLTSCATKPPLGARLTTLKIHSYSEYPTHVILRGKKYPIRNHAKEGLYFIYKRPLRKKIKIYLK